MKYCLAYVSITRTHADLWNYLLHEYFDVYVSVSEFWVWKKLQPLSILVSFYATNTIFKLFKNINNVSNSNKYYARNEYITYSQILPDVKNIPAKPSDNTVPK